MRRITHWINGKSWEGSADRKGEVTDPALGEVTAQVDFASTAVVNAAVESAQVAFREGESFFGNFLRLLGEPGREAEVHFLRPVAPGGDGRRRLAQSCREQIVQAMMRE